MARKEISTSWDAGNRNAMNDNFKELYGSYIDAGFDASEARRRATEALEKSNQALDKSESTQKQLDDIIIDSGTSDAEVIQARGGHDVLNDRLNQFSADLAQSNKKAFFESMVNAKKKRKIVAWIDDDGYKEFYDYFIGLYNEYGAVFNTAIITKHLDSGHTGRLNEQEIKHLQSLGFGIVDHTYSNDSNHRLAQMTKEELHADFSKSKLILESIGVYTDIAVYPFGSQNELVREVARQYYKAGIGTTFHDKPSRVGHYNPDPYDQFHMERINAHNPNEEIFPVIEEAASLNEPVILMSHIGQGEWNPVEKWDDKMRALVEKLLQLGYEFVTMDEYIKLTGNVGQIGDTVFSANGKVYGLGVQFANISDYDLNAPITDFPRNQVTNLKIRRVDSISYGITNNGGTLETHRFDEDFYSYQKFVSGDNLGDVRIRRWSTVNEEWQPWERLGNTRFMGINAYQINAPLTDFPEGKTTIINVRTNDSSSFGLPATTAGVIEVFRSPSDGNYSYQRFNSTNGSGIILTRTWNTANEVWNPWENAGSTRFMGIGGHAVNAPLTDFPIGKITVINVRRTDATSFGLPNSAGIIEVIRPTSENYYALQRFSSVDDDGIVLTRTWNTTANTWTEWK